MTSQDPRLTPLLTALGSLAFAQFGQAAAAPQIQLGGYTFDAAAGPDAALALPGSHPEFGGAAALGCTTVASYPGQSLSESMQTALLSDDVSNWVFGRAQIRLDFIDNEILNLPGPDLVVFEVGGTENFRLRVLSESTCDWSIALTFSVTPTGFLTGCSNNLNARAVELSDFGVLPGASVRRLLIENLGTPGGSVGSDIAQVLALHSAAPQVGLAPCVMSFQQGLAAGPGGYAGAADTCLASDFPGTNFGSVNLEYVDSDVYRCLLLRFDNLIGAASGQIPPGALVSSAQLHLASGPGTSASTQSHFVHRLLQGFNANTITFASGFGGNGVQANSVEAEVASLGQIFPMGANTTQAIDITAAVQAWANGAPNHGLAILPGGNDALGVQLSEAAIATLRPAISVQLESGPWVNLGGALAGSQGLPQFAASGVLSPGSAVTLAVGKALPFGAPILVLGFSTLNLPLLGGTLVPFPDAIETGFVLDASGALTLPITWPNAIPAGLPIVIQFWLADGAGPFGFAATNGLRAVTF